MMEGDVIEIEVTILRLQLKKTTKAKDCQGTTQDYYSRETN